MGFISSQNLLCLIHCFNGIFKPLTAFTWRHTTFYIYYGLVLVALILSCLTDQPPLFCAAIKNTVSLLTISLVSSSSVLYIWCPSL